MDTFPPPDPADLRNGVECTETGRVSVDRDDDVTAILICTLTEDHPGLHYDSVDRLWWANAAGAVA
jgi:hypothetical protein